MTQTLSLCICSATVFDSPYRHRDLVNFYLSFDQTIYILVPMVLHITAPPSKATSHVSRHHHMVSSEASTSPGTWTSAPPADPRLLLHGAPRGQGLKIAASTHRVRFGEEPRPWKGASICGRYSLSGGELCLGAVARLGRREVGFFHRLFAVHLAESRARVRTDLPLSLKGLGRWDHVVAS